MWFIAMSIFIGGKIANVMTKIGNVDNRVTSEKHRIKFIILTAFRFIKRILIKCVTLSQKTFFSTVTIIKKLRAERKKPNQNSKNI
ncbi:hypothetical protein SARI_03081 [Salmonella enterica subsp. arizonae serovar 62:z4,z23:-]|uniref:Uncharacterized protein n=4 Tax=Salmonella enterica TaxID=28901 RepID=A9MS19_SALAR|nr:hypothetical protein SARI_03081 [Salmonella enterica subsp. arizonae serovar 62:z4,z23:-]